MLAPATLAERTTLRVGGPADGWVVAESDDELVEAVRECDDTGTAVLLLGDGSNIVVADSGFRGTVVDVATRGVAVADVPGGVSLSVKAGEPWDDLVDYAVRQGWSGIEALSGIPGRCGSTPIQNVGAYGQEVAQVITSVQALDRRGGEIVTLDPAECGFGYRSSVFKESPGRWAVLGVTMRLSAAGTGAVAYAELARTLGVEVGGQADLRDIRAAVLLLRHRKGMVLDAHDHDTWSAGSFFTNPVVEDDAPVPEGCPRFPVVRGIKLSAAWLIEQAGVPRGFSLGEGSRAAISGRHTLAVTNRGGASAADVMALARAVQDRVRQRFGIALAIEPTLVGDPG